jgi:beta-galactosidase
LQSHAAVAGSITNAEVGLVFDWENMWAINLCNGPRNAGKDYGGQVYSFHTPLWKQGVPVDVIESTCDLSRYKLVIAPMLYMLKPGVAERLDAFVRSGGTLVTTYLHGYVNETDLCFEGGFPGGRGSVARRLGGYWAEELDVLPDARSIPVRMKSGLGLKGTYPARQYFEVIHPESAAVAATFEADYHEGRAAVCVNAVGAGRVIHLAARIGGGFNDDLLNGLSRQLNLKRSSPTPLAAGVICRHRERADGGLTQYYINVGEEPATQKMPGGKSRRLNPGEIWVVGSDRMPGK